MNPLPMLSDAPTKRRLSDGYTVMRKELAKIGIDPSQVSLASGAGVTSADRVTPSVAG